MVCFWRCGPLVLLIAQSPPEVPKSGIGIRYRQYDLIQGVKAKTGVGAAAMGSICDVGSSCGEALLNA